jgi:hypothetical protein
LREGKEKRTASISDPLAHEVKVEVKVRQRKNGVVRQKRSVKSKPEATSAFKIDKPTVTRAKDKEAEMMKARKRNNVPKVRRRKDGVVGGDLEEALPTTGATADTCGTWISL